MLSLASLEIVKWRQILGLVICATKIKTNRRFGHVCDRLVIRHRLWWLWVSNVVPPCPHASICHARWYSTLLRFGMVCTVCLEVCQQCGPLANHRLAHNDWSRGPHITCHLGQQTLLGTEGLDFKAGGPDGHKKWVSPPGDLDNLAGGLVWWASSSPPCVIDCIII